MLKHERSNSYIFITNDERVFCRLNFKRNSVYGHIVFPTYTIHFVKQPYQELEFTKKVQQLTVVKKAGFLLSGQVYFD